MLGFSYGTQANELELPVSTWKILRCNMELPALWAQSLHEPCSVSLGPRAGRGWLPNGECENHTQDWSASKQPGSNAQISIIRNLIFWVKVNGLF